VPTFLINTDNRVLKHETLEAKTTLSGSLFQ